MTHPGVGDGLLRALYRGVIVRAEDEPVESALDISNGYVAGSFERGLHAESVEGLRREGALGYGSSSVDAAAEASAGGDVGGETLDLISLFVPLDAYLIRGVNLYAPTKALVGLVLSVRTLATP